MDCSWYLSSLNQNIRIADQVAIAETENWNEYIRFNRLLIIFLLMQ